MLRKPNFLLFFIALVLAVVGVTKYLGIPIHIPEIPGVAIPKIPENLPGVSQLSSMKDFWILFSAWALLFLASLRLRRGRSIG